MGAEMDELGKAFLVSVLQSDTGLACLKTPFIATALIFSGKAAFTALSNVANVAFLTVDLF